MNLALFNESFLPQLDGVAVTVENYARIFNEQYGKSFVAIPSHPKRKQEFPYPVWEYKSSPITVADQYRIGIPVSAKLSKSFHENDIEIVHSHCPFTSGLLAQRLATKNGVPHISTFHSKYKEDINLRLKTNFEMPGEIIARYVVAFYSRCDHIWSVSNGTANTLREYGYKGDITVMPNGCDMPITHCDSEVRKKIFAKYEFDDDAPMLLFVGRHTFTKNTDIIIKALGAIARHNKKFNMLFVGDGEDSKEMRSMVEQQGLSRFVRFAGKICERDILKDIYSSSDLFLFPSVYDNAPLVVREAAACGCASVLISGSNSAEGLIDGKNVFLSNETNEDFALTLNNALECSNLEEIGQNARRDIYISWNDVLSMVQKEYEKISGEWKKSKHKKGLHKKVVDFGTNIDVLKEYDINFAEMDASNTEEEKHQI